MNSLKANIMTMLNRKKGRKCTPHVGADIKTLAPGKYRSIRAAASRSDPVPERPWTVATWGQLNNVSDN